MYHRRLACALTGALVIGALSVAGSSVSARHRPLAPSAPAEPAPPGARFAELGRYTTGAATGDETAAEIVAYEDDTLYVMSVGKIDVVDISDPAAPVKTGEIALPGDPTSVAVSDGLVAVSVPGEPRTSPGTVLFFRRGEPVGEVTVGALPDMVTFTPDGRTLVVANEGEPNSYGQPDSIDPEGTISLIDTKRFETKGKSGTYDRYGRNDRGSGLARSRSRSSTSARSATASSPPGSGSPVRTQRWRRTSSRSTSPSTDTGRTAWVSLQENNALAVHRPEVEAGRRDRRARHVGSLRRRLRHRRERSGRTRSTSPTGPSGACTCPTASRTTRCAARHTC